ncbi:putative defense protein Hdd11 [Cylas formicarius]|uniref:putative defense protein Hdd11 n=1 Tax=Cylas formicarius TaxID=197179 RepID=UPI0029584359|nr:putative defense protein Hdd11 [Cylas formicarius]
MNKVIAITTLLSLAGAVWGYSGGAPESVCGDMIPKHPADPQKSPFPYKVTVDNGLVKPGQEVKITVTGKPFKGFIIQVRDANQKAVGSFLIPADDKFMKAINCHTNKGSAATHKNSTDKSDITLVWKAPEAAGKYTVTATIAQDGATFWTAKPTEVINVE